MYIGDYTTRLYRDYNKPLKGSLLTNQDFMESRAVFFFRGGDVHFVVRFAGWSFGPEDWWTHETSSSKL